MGEHETVRPQPDFVLVMPATPEHMMLARQALKGFAEGARWDPNLLADVRVALSEACSNAIVHAYRDRPPGPVRIALTATADGVAVEIADEGAWIEPAAGSGPGLGLGLPLMEALSQSLQIDASAGRPTTVRMRFAFPAEGSS